jgi:quercetin dioxygenase-like cupin family protein
MTIQPAVILDDLPSLGLDQAQPEIYDRPIGLRLLYNDPDSGVEHYLIRYPDGLHAQPHRHTAAHTILVLDGALEVDGQLLNPGGYAHHPGGTVMRHAPAAGHHCLFVIMFHGEFDVIPVDETPAR